LSKVEQIWATLSRFFGLAWVISRNFEHLCQAILNIFWKHDMALLTLNRAQNVSIEVAFRHLTLAEKCRWCKPHGSRP
jgi:hypothetical protein